jgi:hypothetical protein
MYPLLPDLSIFVFSSNGLGGNIRVVVKRSIEVPPVHRHDLSSFNFDEVELGPFGLEQLKFNSHHINVPSNAWSIKCRLITCISVQIRSNLRDKSIKPN